jgi:hypothetical protein
LEKYIKKIINKGDENGNEMVVKFQLPSGLEIVGLPTKNFYGGHWDLGPTWNYAVMADSPFLVDSGRFGQGKKLIGMLESAGISAKDLEFVLISHSHEDHDGGLAELVESTQLKVKAHAVYDLLIRQYPEDAPGGYRENFPAKYHIERCTAILEILNNRPKSAVEIAQELFDAKLLEGLGSMMAANEVISHCELLIAGGDVAAIDGNNYAVTGNTDFKIYIESLRSEY